MPSSDEERKEPSPHRARNRRQSLTGTGRRPSQAVAQREAELTAEALQDLIGGEPSEPRRPDRQEAMTTPGEVPANDPVENKPEQSDPNGAGDPCKPASPPLAKKGIRPSSPSARARANGIWSKSFNERAASYADGAEKAKLQLDPSKRAPNSSQFESMGRKRGKLSEFTAGHQGMHDPSISSIQETDAASWEQKGSIVDVTFARYDVYNSTSMERDFLSPARANRWKSNLNAVLRFGRLRNTSKVMDMPQQQPEPLELPPVIEASTVEAPNVDASGVEESGRGGIEDCCSPMAKTSTDGEAKDSGQDSGQNGDDHFDVSMLKSSTGYSKLEEPPSPPDAICMDNPHLPKRLSIKRLSTLKGARRASVMTMTQHNTLQDVQSTIASLQWNAAERDKDSGPRLKKAFGADSKELLDRMTRKENRTGPLPTTQALKVLLSSEKTMDELIDLVYDKPRLTREVKALIKREVREDKLAQKLEELELSEEKQLKKRMSMVAAKQRQEDERAHQEMLGYSMPKETFRSALQRQPYQARNQIVVARLMNTLMEVNAERDHAPSILSFLNCYRCLDPDHWLINLWTVLYVLLILYIATAGLFNVCFPIGSDSFLHQAEEAPDCNTDFSAQQWLDASVDLFFIIDIFLRLFLFGFVVEGSGSTAGSTVEKVRDPDKVFLHYAKTALIVDLLTGVPISWISMVLEATCASHTSGLLLARGLRVFRVTRVIKLFRTYKVRMWVRRLKRSTGNTSIMQIMHLVVGLAFLNHIWTCISWVVQSADERSFEDYKAMVGLDDDSTRLEQYSVTFMITLQNLFAIEPYRGNTVTEAWFGSLTLAISVFVSSTMLSKILEIWQMANEAQTQRDTRINTVMQFTARNGISTDLRNEVLDYFEFRYSNPSADFAKRFMDDLPSEMQARVISQMFPGALEKSGLFKGASEMFISQLIVKMARRPVPTMPLQVIIAQGSYNSEMFLLKSGSVEVTTQDEHGQQRRIRSLGPGSTFGDLSMWMDSRQAASVTSLDFCQLHVLTRSDLEDALLSFPEVAHVIASQALAHCLRTPGMAPHLEGLSVATSEKMGRRLAYNRVEFDPGIALYIEGEFADAAYVIRKGKVESELLGGRLEGLEDMRCVGFDALLTGWPYQETVRASGAVVAYRISAQDIIDLFTNDFELLVEREEVAERWYLEEKRRRVAMTWALLAEDILSHHRKQDEEMRQLSRTPVVTSTTQEEHDQDLAARLRRTLAVSQSNQRASDLRRSSSDSTEPPLRATSVVSRSSSGHSGGDQLPLYVASTIREHHEA